DLLHPGEKRLVFCQSRSQTEQLAAELRAREVTTVVSHSSLSPAERRFAERTFADAPECVVVATSTLELGVDIGDLDRVIQIDAPNTVASFLQRLGRTGRRPGSTRNMLFLATEDGPLVQTAALLNLWASGYVEQVTPPPSPWHIAAQQLLALGLQEGRYPLTEWRDWWPGLDWMRDARDVLQHLLDEGYLSFDGGFAILGDAAERTYGRRNFLELTSVFTAAPEFAVLHGRVDIGTVSPLALSAALPAGVPRVLSLAGRGWRVTHVDWQRRRVFVVPDPSRGKSVWNGGSPTLGFELAQAIRDVLVGHDPPVTLSGRASARLAAIRAAGEPQPPAEGTMLAESQGSRVWWTWAGSKANASLAAALEAQGHRVAASPLSVTCSSDVGTGDLRHCADLLASEDAAPHLDRHALAGLKFSELLPEGLAAATVANRITDNRRAQEVAQQPITRIRV
ncbi:MAG: ATP-dependent helicase Lhr and Lhr-like helicase, partial [Actinomycetota bacterium]|nr:ATP-dependent helicase Lhr and Lhr-like helicase [Actinomycetota bacterium]